MNPTERTIAFLRTLTLDQVLTAEEVWSLAKFLNDHPECQEVWPGDLLGSMLRSAFDDNELTEEEMSLLARTLSDIEAEWLSRHPARTALETMAAVGFTTTTPRLPALDVAFEIPSTRDATVHRVNLQEHQCSCEDWRTRRESWPSGHLGRCCKHVASGFTRTGRVFPRWMQTVLDDCFNHARGTPADAEWRLLEAGSSPQFLLAATPGGWCSVYALGEDGYEIFAFHPAYNRWSYGESPNAAIAVEQAIRTANWEE